jgi:hypothetical protein
MGERPILYMRVKKAKKVNISGAQIHSYSSRVSMMEKGCGLVSNWTLQLPADGQP